MKWVFLVYPFYKEETKEQNHENLSQATLLVSDRAGTGIQAVLLYGQILFFFFGSPSFLSLKREPQGKVILYIVISGCDVMFGISVILLLALG